MKICEDDLRCAKHCQTSFSCHFQKSQLVQFSTNSSGLQSHALLDFLPSQPEGGSGGGPFVALVALVALVAPLSHQWQALVLAQVSA